ncbi:hypothetical protein HYV74_01910 [Candidatus Uhrbacteria bacterium]|nr:hypothetical protein [Candidatus Uhrbacteria bacterium]
MESLRDRLARQSAATRDVPTATEQVTERMRAAAARERQEADRLIGTITEDLDRATGNGNSECIACRLHGSDFTSEALYPIAVCRERLERGPFSSELLRGTPRLLAEHFLAAQLEVTIWFHFVENRRRGWSAEYAFLVLAWGPSPLGRIFTRDATEDAEYHVRLSDLLHRVKFTGIFVPERLENL